MYELYGIIFISILRVSLCWYSIIIGRDVCNYMCIYEYMVICESTCI